MSGSITLSLTITSYVLGIITRVNRIYHSLVVKTYARICSTISESSVYISTSLTSHI